MPAQRAVLRAGAIEALEARGLLSASAPVQPLQLEIVKVHPSAVLVSVPEISVQHAHVTPAKTVVERKSGDPSHEGRTDDGDAPGQSPARNSSGPAGVLKRGSSYNLVQREVAASIVVQPRGPDSTSTEENGDGLTALPEVIYGGSGSDVSESVGFASVGWAPDAAVAAVVAAASSPGRPGGLDGRMGTGSGASGATIAPPGPAGATVAFEGAGAVNPQAAVEIGGDESWAIVMARAALAPGSSIAGWADLLDGALKADWEAMDKEMRQFLARLGVASAADGRGSGPTWPFWVGALAAMLAARRVSSVRRRVFARRMTGESRGSGSRTIPVGPWPLGSP